MIVLGGHQRTRQRGGRAHAHPRSWGRAAQRQQPVEVARGRGDRHVAGDRGHHFHGDLGRSPGQQKGVGIVDTGVRVDEQRNHGISFRWPCILRPDARMSPITFGRRYRMDIEILYCSE